jgi:hypothetical protein
MINNIRQKNQCLNICYECIEECEFNIDEQFVDTELGGTWIRIGNEWGLYKDGICMGIVTIEEGNSRIRKLKIRASLQTLKNEIKKAFLNDMQKIKDFFKRWII